MRNSALFMLWMSLMSAGANASATAEGTVRATHSEIELLAERRWIEVGPGAEPTTFAIRVKPESGWHTYWKNAGDSGLPLRLDWSLPEGFRAGEIRWPRPVVLSSPPLRNYGYESESYLLVDMIPGSTAARAGTLKFSAQARWLVCKDVCLPVRAEIAISLPARERASVRPDERKPDYGFQRARDKIPVPLPTPTRSGDSGWKVMVESSDASVNLTVTPLSPVGGIEFFPSTPGVFDHARISEPVRQTDGRSWTWELPIQHGGTSLPAVLTGTLVTDQGAYDLEVPLQAVYRAPRPAVSLLRILLFAFAGGFLLNLMPCVFPILSLKLLAFGRESHREAVRDATYFGLGTMAFLWALVGVLIALRASGLALGWGFQLQSPVFVAFLAILFTALGLNLMGLFEIGGAWMGWGSRVTSRGGSWGSFWTGALNVLVATPCTAPFMGVALGFALSSGVLETFAVFTTLGLGMLSPYIAVAALPTLQKSLPKPGPWMVVFRELLAFPLFATVIWLVWTWGRLVGITVPVAGLGVALMIGFVFWALRKRHLAPKHRAARIVALLLITALGVGGAWLSLRERPAGIAWKTYSPGAVDADVARGETVFIDFTAAWCVTCQVNERTALSDARVIERFRSLRVQAYQADWTSSDPVITRALENYGRNAVPVYVLYLPGRGGQPTLLPELLTPGLVLDALEGR